MTNKKTKTLTELELEQVHRAGIERTAGDVRQRQNDDLPSLGIHLSEKERAVLQVIYDKYVPLLNTAVQAEKTASATRPDVNAYYQGISPVGNPEGWQAAQKQAADAVRAWEASAPQEWKDAQTQLNSIIERHVTDTNALYRAAYKRQLKELGNDPEEISKQAKEQVDLLIVNKYTRYKEQSKTAISMSAHDMVALGGKEWKLDAAETRARIVNAMDMLYFKALGNNTKSIAEIKAYIDSAILASPYIAPEGTPGVFDVVVFRERPAAGSHPEEMTGLALLDLTPDFIYGAVAVMPTSKVVHSQIAMSKESGRVAFINVGGKDEARADVKASITADRELPSAAIEIQNAIGEMMLTNGNRIIHVTRAQVWRAFACLDEGVKVSDHNLEYVGVIVNLLAKAAGRIDFTQQVEKHKKMKKQEGYNYVDGAVISGPLVVMRETLVVAGGHETKGFILYDLPLFFLHSHLTNQITRIDKTLLDTTAEKITDGQGKKHKVEARHNDLGFIMLKRHLARQVEMIKSKKAKGELHYNDNHRLFEEIGRAIGANNPARDKEGNVTGMSKLTDRQTRTMRENIDLLCTRWKIQGYIQDYEFYRNRGNRAYAGVEIDV